MGMTGRISTPDTIPQLESLSNENISYAPPNTHLIIKSINHNKTIKEIAFSDPRKFGAICLNDNGALEQQWNEFATDALQANLDGLVGQRKGVKAILLDQRAVVSGVGNWIADELLYQTHIHPDQTYLTKEEVELMTTKLKYILTTGIKLTNNEKDFPEDWLFHYRWGKGKGNVKDYKGRKIVFLQSGGRTSAVVPALQKKKGRKCIVSVSTSKEQMKKKDEMKKSSKRKNTTEAESKKQQIKSRRSVTTDASLDTPRRRSKRIAAQV